MAGVVAGWSDGDDVGDGGDYDDGNDAAVAAADDPRAAGIGWGDVADGTVAAAAVRAIRATACDQFPSRLAVRWAPPVHNVELDVDVVAVCSAVPVALAATTVAVVAAADDGAESADGAGEDDDDGDDGVPNGDCDDGDLDDGDGDGVGVAAAADVPGVVDAYAVDGEDYVAVGDGVTCYSVWSLCCHCCCWRGLLPLWPWWRQPLLLAGRVDVAADTAADADADAHEDEHAAGVGHEWLSDWQMLCSWKCGCQGVAGGCRCCWQ